MILQIGAFFGSLLNDVVSPTLKALAPSALQIGQQYLTRELSRGLVNDQKKALKAQAVQVLNSPGISVATLGGTIQPVGGAVQRSTYTPAPMTPSQSPYGNIPLVNVTAAAPRVPLDVRNNPAFRYAYGTGPASPTVLPGKPSMLSLNGTGNGYGIQKYALDNFGRTQKYWPSPNPQEGYLPVEQARMLYGSRVTRPFYRFNRVTGGFEKVKARRMNPFNFRAAHRAGARVNRTLDAVKELVQVSNKLDKGVSTCGKRIRLKKKKKRKRCG